MRTVWQLGLLAALLASCQTTGPKKRDGGSDANSGEGSSGGEEKGEDKGSEESYVSSNLQTMTYSLTNNNLTSFTVNTGKAKSLAEDLESKLKNPTAKDRKELIALMAAKRLAGEGVVPVFQAAKRLMVVEMKENIKKNMPEVAMLELTLASIQSKQIPMAEHWINKLLASKNPKTKAAAHTAQGMIALLDNRLPEAVAFWNEALKAKSDYEPARLNIAFSALRFGDYKTAKAMFEGVRQDWFVQTGMMQTERLSDNPQGAAELCKSILEKKGNYKPALFSCALNEYQGLGNLAKARVDLEKIAKSSGGPSAIDEKTFLVLGKIEKEIMIQQQKEGAAKAAAAAAARKAAAPPQGTGAPAEGAATTTDGAAPAPQGTGGNSPPTP
jgi:hypothetical protein